MNKIERHQRLSYALYQQTVQAARHTYPDGSDALIERVVHSLLSTAQEMAYAAAYYPMRSPQINGAQIHIPVPVHVEEERTTSPYDVNEIERLRHQTARSEDNGATQ